MFIKQGLIRKEEKMKMLGVEMGATSKSIGIIAQGCNPPVPSITLARFPLSPLILWPAPSLSLSYDRGGSD